MEIYILLKSELKENEYIYYVCVWKINDMCFFSGCRVIYYISK